MRTVATAAAAQLTGDGGSRKATGRDEDERLGDVERREGGRERIHVRLVGIDQAHEAAAHERRAENERRAKARHAANIAGTSGMSAMYSAKIRLATLAMPPSAITAAKPSPSYALATACRLHLGRGQGGAQGRVGEGPCDRADAHRGDRDQHGSAQHAAAAAHLGAEVEREARAQEQQRDVGSPARQRPGRRVRRELARHPRRSAAGRQRPARARVRSGRRRPRA